MSERDEAAPRGGVLRTLDELKLWQRVHWRLTLLYAVAVFAVLGGMSATVYHYGVESELETLQARLRSVSLTLAQTLDAEGLMRLEREADMERPEYREAMEDFGAIIERYPQIVAIYVLRPTEEAGQLRFAVDYSTRVEHVKTGEMYDATRIPKMLEGLERPSVEDEPVGDEYGLTISGYAPIAGPDGEPVGLVGVDIEASRIEQIERRVLIFALICFGVAGGLLSIAAVIAGRFLRKPLSRAMEAADSLAEGRFDVEIISDRGDEFGLLSDHFNHMASGLRERDFIRETFGRYVSEDVAQTLLADESAMQLGGEEREVTVLFSDLRGYSTLSEVLSPTEIVTFLNDYLGAMNAVIDQHRGCVIEYLGDAILAVFNAPNALPDHAERAVRCAIEMRERLDALNATWEASGRSALWTEQGLDAIGQRIGVHTGSVVAGNLGSKTRMKYAVIGDNVNIAARLEQMNKKLETEILISEDVYGVLPDDLQERARDLDKHRVKGREQPVHIYAF